MKIFAEGDKSTAFCNCCSDLVETTISLRDVPFSDGHGIVKNLLVGICDKCNQVVSIPAQSLQAITAAHAGSGQTGSSVATDTDF